MTDRVIRVSLLRALRVRPFVLMWGGQTISRLGDALYRVALAWWVLQKTGSAGAMGMVLVFTTLPMLLFLLIGGVAVDRFSRAKVMLVSDALRGVLVAGMAWLAWADRLQMGYVYALAAVFGFVSAFFQPAYQALVPDIVPPDELPSANALTSLSRQLVGIGGPALGASLVALGGTTVAFALDALSFALAAVCLLPLLRLAEAIAPATQRASMLGELRAGLALVFATPWLWITIALFSLVNVTEGGPMAVGLPLLVQDHYGADVGALGIFFSVMSLGSVLTAVWLGRAHAWRQRGVRAYGGALIGGVAVMVIGLTTSLPIGWSAAFVNGAALAVFGLIWTNTLQEMVPRDMLGRVVSVDMLGSFVLLPIGYALTGWLADQIGPAPVFVIGGALTVALMALGLAHPAIRHLD